VSLHVITLLSREILILHRRKTTNMDSAGDGHHASHYSTCPGKEKCDEGTQTLLS
jgi:hypothetical protein